MGLEGGYRHSTSRHPGRPAGGNGEAGPEPGRGEAHSASQRDGETKARGGMTCLRRCSRERTWFWRGNASRPTREALE